MPKQVPAWLGSALPQARAGHAGLAAVLLGGEKLLGCGGFALSSAAFADGEALDPSFTAQEDDSVAPPIEWTAPPPGTAELVLVVEDPDAPQGTVGEAEPFCHWLVWGLAPQKGKLLEGEAPPRVGKNAFGNSEWLLPDPPLGEPAHDYVFQLFALDTPLALMPGANRAELFAAMQGHVIGVTLLTGTFARSEGNEEDDDWDDG